MHAQQKKGEMDQIQACSVGGVRSVPPMAGVLTQSTDCLADFFNHLVEVS